MGYPIFMMDNGAMPGQQSDVANGICHYFVDDYFLLEDTEGNTGTLRFSKVKKMPWIAIGGVLSMGHILGAIETSDGRYYVLMSMAAQRQLTASGISNPRAKSDQAELIRTFYENYCEAFDKAYRKEISKFLKKPMDSDQVEEIRAALIGRD